MLHLTYYVTKMSTPSAVFKIHSVDCACAADDFFQPFKIHSIDCACAADDFFQPFTERASTNHRIIIFVYLP